MLSLQHFLVLSAILFSIGIFGVLTRRNAVAILLSLELIFNAVNINLVAFSYYVTPQWITGQIFAVFVITIAAAEVVVGLSIVLSIYRHLRVIDVENINLLKG